MGIYEVLYEPEQWKLLFVESEELKKTNLNSQYKFLKEKIHPHFLFNSLNTLTALILTDAFGAVQFLVVKNLSLSLFVASQQKPNLLLLKKSSHSWQSYTPLLPTSFRRLRLKSTSVSVPFFDQYLIPPFVLQRLIEYVVIQYTVPRFILCYY